MHFGTSKIAIPLSVVVMYYGISKAADVVIGGFLFIVESKTYNTGIASDNNLDIVADVNITARDNKFQEFAEAYFYPLGYGCTYMESADLEPAADTVVARKTQTRQKTQKTNKTKESKVSVVNAWGRYTTKYFQLQIGRSTLKYSHSSFFGDYLHRGSGPFVDYHGSVQNCLSFINRSGTFTTNVLIGANNFHFEKGYLTIREVFKPAETGEVAFGYQGTIIYPLLITNAGFLNNLSLSARLNYGAGQCIYTEFGIRGLGAPKDGAERFPFMLGCTIPTFKLLTKLTIETEYDKKRESADNRGAFSFGMCAMKTFNKHFLTTVSCHNGLSQKPEAIATRCKIKMLF